MSRVEIVGPDPSWPADFRTIADALRRELGSLALRIDHIGSTSVPGLVSKDIVDVQVTVAALDRDRLVPAFGRAGFDFSPHVNRDHRPPGVTGPEEDWTKLYFQPPPGGRRAHVHVRVGGKPNQRYALLFRDYLRAHPEATAAYAELKRRLAALGIESGVYADVKDPVCDLIVIAAEAWTAQGGWRLGPSDA